MEELRRHRDTVREAVTRGVAAIQLLLQDPLSSTGQIRSHLHAVDSRYEELKSLDKRIYEETIDLDDLEADLFDSYEYDEKVVTIRTLVCFARPSAVPPPIAARSTGAPSDYSAVIRHGKTAAPSGDSGMTAEADKVANVPAACEPCVSDRRNVLTAADESDPPEKPAESTTDSIEAQLGAPSRPTSGDCVVVQDGHGTDLSKDPTTTMYGDADPSSVMLLDASDIAAARRGSLLREHVVVKCRKRAPFPLVRRWPCCSRRWLLRWHLRWSQRFLVSPTLIGAPAFRVGSHEPSGDPGCGEIVNGNRGASTATLGGPLGSSRKPHHPLPRSSLLRHGVAVRDRDVCTRRAVTCEQLPSLPPGTGYVRACRGHRTGFVSLRLQPEQGEFPYDPGGYGEPGEQDGYQRTGASNDLLAHQLFLTISHATMFNEYGEEELAAVKEACRGKLDQVFKATMHPYRQKGRLNHEGSQSIRHCKEPRPKIARYLAPTPEPRVVGLSLPGLNKTGTRKLHHSSKHRWKRKQLTTGDRWLNESQR